MRRFFSQILLLSFCIVLLLSFQNCVGSVISSSANSILNISRLNNGNGGTYDGLQANFLAYMPQFACEGNSTYISAVTTTDGTNYFLTANQSNQCSTTATAISKNQIDFSPFQNNFIVVQNYLYEQYTQIPVGIPENLPEVLCRDNYTNPSIEIITHYDTVTSGASTQLYYYASAGQPGPAQTDAQSSRLFSSTKLDYVAFAGQMKFSVDLTATIPTSPGKYAGTLTVQASSLNVPGLKSGSLTCVVGDGLNLKFWPLQTVVDQEVETFHVQPGTGDIYFSGRNPLSSNINEDHLFRVGAGSSYTDITQNFFASNFALASFNFVQNSNKLVVQGNLDTDSAHRRAYLLQIDSTDTPRQIMNRGSEASESLNLSSGFNTYYDQVVEVAPNTFSLWVQKLGTFNNATAPQSSLLRLYNYVSDSLQDNLASVVPTYHTQSLENNMAIAFVQNSAGQISLQLFNTISSQVKTLALPDLPGCVADAVVQSPLMLPPFLLDTADQKIIVNFKCTNGSSSLMALALDGSAAKQVGQNKTILWRSTSGDWVMLATLLANGNYDATTTSFYRLADGLSVKTTIDSQLYNSNAPLIGTNFPHNSYAPTMALIQEHYLAGFSADGSGRVMLFDQNTQTEAEVCSNATGTRLNLGNFPPGRAYLVTLNSATAVYSFYEILPGGNCPLLNSFPMSSPSISNFLVTRSGFAVLFAKTNVFNGNMFDSTLQLAVFIPTSGKAALYLNPDGNLIHQIQQMELAPDGSKILLSGTAYDSVTNGSRLYFFSVP